MKFLSDNLLTFALAILLGLSPLQSISASVSKCMNMSKSMHQQMKKSDTSIKAEMSKSDNKHDSCNGKVCGSTHCASSSVAAITSSNDIDVSYNESNFYPKANVLLIPYYPSSLYRPPRV